MTPDQAFNMVKDIEFLRLVGAGLAFLISGLGICLLMMMSNVIKLRAALAQHIQAGGHIQASTR
jgi:hypothetical protein